MAGIGHNSGRVLDPDYVDQRHALQIAIRDCPDLSPRAKFAGLVITTFMDQKGQGASPAYRLIAKITGYGVNEIKKLGEALAEAFLIIRKKVGGKRGMVYDTALYYEQAIEIYCRGQRNAYTVSQENRLVSPSEGDTNTDNNPVQDLVSPSRSDTNADEASDTTVVSPETDLVSPKSSVESPSGGDRRQKTEDRQTGGGISDVLHGLGGDDEKVVNLNRDGDEQAVLVQKLQQILKPFGNDGANQMLQDMVQWSGKGLMGVAPDVICNIGIFGSLNYLEAWQATRTQPRRTPMAYLTTVLKSKLDELGKRDIPEPDSGGEHYRPGEWLRKEGRMGL